MHKIYHGVTFYNFCVGNVIERFLYLLDNAKKELSLCYKLGFIKLDAKIYGLANLSLWQRQSFLNAQLVNIVLIKSLF